MLQKIEKALTVIIAVSFGLYCISTFIGNDFLMALLSPVVVGLVLILLICQLPKLGPFNQSSIAMAAGLFLWFIGDILFFCNDYVLEVPGSITSIVEDIYLYPNAFFALCISIYMFSMLRSRKIELAFLMSNTLCFAIIGFVLIYRFHMLVAGDSHNGTHYKELVFFFLSFYTIMMCFQLLYHLGIKNIFRGTVFTTVGILGYAIIDIYYDFKQALGEDAENDYLNLFYVLFMVLMVLGTTIQLNKKYEFIFLPRDFTKKATKRRFFLFALLIFCTIGAILAGLLPNILGLYVIVTILSYLITNYVLYSESLDAKMLEYQKEQNAILEKRINEKTRDLADANDSLKILSTTDMLTGLQNRRSSRDFLKSLDKQYKENGTSYAVFCIDLNHFKPVNDTYGHETGDRVLSEFGKRMNDLPTRFHPFRIGGDEFLICMTEVANHGEVESAADMIRTLFNSPIIYDNYIFNLSASIGIAICPDDCKEYELLVKYADTAMYDIKRSKNRDGYKFFDSKMTQIIDRNKSIVLTVAQSLPDRDYELYYQPQVNADTGEIIGVEVYPHLKGEMEDVSPAELIPIAEEAGLMSSLGLWILRQAFETISAWNVKYGMDMGFAINLSPLQLLDADLIEALESISARYGIETSRVILDISNEVIVGASGSARDTMEALHNFGYKLSLNDFGGKNINLSYLMDCGINCIELSRNLIAGINKEKTRKLVESIIKFAATMGITVAAVGIETKEQYETLHKMGVTQMQGYLMSKPVRHADFEKWLNDHGRVFDLPVT